MAIIDYGAILKVDGKFVNRDTDLFMTSSDTGYVCTKAEYKDGTKINIDKNYFVYAGDEHFLLVFYKNIYRIISDGKILYYSWGMPFISETHYFDHLPSVKVSHLDETLHTALYETGGPWSEYVKERWLDATGNEKLSDLEGGRKAYKHFLKHSKRISYANKHGGLYKYRSERFFAEWEYNGHRYEVIFGFGIDPRKEVWDEIKYESYGFTEKERQLIDKWFQE